ncbi:MAG: hypothetical protein VX833_01735 [Actinomycetota bacterium]|nr:hypothetical protein [Actinomycetota bacterium]
MDRLLILGVVAVAASITAALLQRWRPKEPMTAAHSIPQHLSRADFDQPDAPWLVAVFSSEDCSACTPIVAEAHNLADVGVTVQEVPVSSSAGLHRRYGVDAVPMLLIADADGRVCAHHLGPATNSELHTLLDHARSLPRHSQP